MLARGPIILDPLSPYYYITAAWAVDREFVYIVGPAWVPFGRLGPPLGSHWDAFGATLVSLWSPFGSLWVLLGPL